MEIYISLLSVEKTGEVRHVISESGNLSNPIIPSGQELKELKNMYLGYAEHRLIKKNMVKATDYFLTFMYYSGFLTDKYLYGMNHIAWIFCGGFIPLTAMKSNNSSHSEKLHEKRHEWYSSVSTTTGKGNIIRTSILSVEDKKYSSLFPDSPYIYKK